MEAVMYIIAGRKLDKSPERLAMEIKGKPPADAYNHLLKYGLREAEAAEVVALFRGGAKVNGTVWEIAEAIEDAVRSIPYDPDRIKEIFSSSWRCWLPTEERR